MSSGDVTRPFRWDITRRSQLGSLPDLDPPETYPEFEADLMACAARVLAFAGDSDLVFVGRSPDPLFDVLSGLLFDTSWSDRLRLLSASMTYTLYVDEASVRSGCTRHPGSGCADPVARVPGAFPRERDALLPS